jgi:hypothetical protein
MLDDVSRIIFTDEPKGWTSSSSTPQSIQVEANEPSVTVRDVPAKTSDIPQNTSSPDSEPATGGTVHA